LSLVFHRLSF